MYLLAFIYFLFVFIFYLSEKFIYLKLNIFVCIYINGKQSMLFNIFDNFLSEGSIFDPS